MTIASEITRIKNNIAAAYTSAGSKGASLPSVQNSANLASCIDTISSGGGITPSGTINITENGTYNVTNYANAAVNVSGGGSSGGDWQPDPDWFDIESILQADTENYAGKAIILYSNSDDFTQFTISSPISAIKTSDGAFYTSSVTHTWDKTKDKIISPDSSDNTPKLGTRYIILYFNTADVLYTALTNFRLTSLYAVFKCNLTKNSSSSISSNTFFNSNSTLQSFKFLNGYNLSFGTNFNNFCRNCYSLQNLPDNLDVSNGTNFNGFCNNCRSLQNLPDNLNVSNGTNFYNFCSNCYSLQNLPDNLDVSNGTIFDSFCYNCYSLQNLPDNLDVSNGTNFGSFCSTCYSLVKANIKLAPVSVTALSSSTVISVQSLKYIADNAPSVTDTRTLTIGSTNIARAGGASGSIITTLTNKGWTVN